MRSISAKMVALVSFILTTAPPTAADVTSCACKYIKAHSEAPSGICSVREDYPRDCDLLWAATPGTQPVGTQQKNDDSTVIREIRGAATRSPNPRAESAAPGLSKIGDEEFWRGFQSEVPRRSGVREGDLYNQSLNFLLNKGAGSDFPQFVAAALIFISAAGLQQSVVDVDLRRGFLDALLANSDRFVAFARGNSEPRPFDRATDVKTREGKFFKLNVKGIALLGCFEFFEDELHVTQLVKADWSPAKGGRCQ